MLTLYPPAKINLCLEVIGRRPDGYHEVVTVMQTVDWSDELTVEPADTLTLTCDAPALENEGNLVLKAARLVQSHTRSGKGARITLRKRIPWGAGLGGGSSDAASTVVALNRLWGTGLSHEELANLAARLGSDVAFFLRGGTALAEGRGERVTPLAPAPRGWAVLLVPPIALEGKTGRLYSLLKPEHFTSGETARRWTGALAEGRAWGDMPPMLNTFEQVADTAFPGLASYREAFHNTGAEGVHLSGAGPTLFCVSATEEEARRVCAALRHTDAVVRVAQMTG